MEDDFGYPFLNISEYFENDDFSMVNLEGPLVDDGFVTTEKPEAFRGPEKFVNILSQNSVEAVTLANNHTMDCFRHGYDTTKSVLEEAGVSYVEKGSTMLHTTASGLTVGVYAEEYVDMDMDRLTSGVALLREQGAEIVIYAVHWGYEHNYYPLDSQISWAHQAVDAGVDIVYGHHPHVLQNIEHYNGSVIFYSLANFIFGGNPAPLDLDTALVRQQVIRYPDGRVELGELTAIPMSVSSVTGYNNFQPTPYPEGSEEYSRVLEKLAGDWKGRYLPFG